MAIIQGTSGNDVLTGGTGDDRIIGSAGDDTLASGGGNDTLDYSGLGKPITALQGVINKGGLGTDLITNFLNIVGATGQSNTLDATGARGGGRIDINLAKNTFNVNSFQRDGVNIPIPQIKVINFVNALGGPNDDTLVGSNTGGKLTGGGGNDRITGGKGKDILTGTDSTARGVGEVDSLTGGGGRDRFVLGDRNGAYYVGQGNNDYAKISDFNLRQDTLDFGSAKNISFKIESSGAVDVFAGKDPNNRDLIAKIQVKGGFPGRIQRGYRSGMSDRNTSSGGDLLANAGSFGSDTIGSQFNLIKDGSNFTNTSQT
jgi:Ca2+-binding RTX toxin-like protein